MKADEVIIYSDMDGTLLTDWSLGPIIPNANIEAIRRFISKGGLFSVATGRQFGETMKFFGEIQFSLPTVQGNGAVIYDSTLGKVIKKTILPERVKLECLNYANRKKGVWLAAADEFNIYQIESGDKAWDDKLSDLKRTLITVEEYLALDLVKTCYILAEPADLPSVTYDLQSFESSDLFRITQSSPVFLEVLEKSVGKGAGVAEAIRLSGVKGRKLVCIGDYDNDCDMLALADISACPSDASPRVLEMAQVITCSNNEGAVADLISKLGLN